MYVYRYLNAFGKIIYVGKTNNMNNRQSQHFSSTGHLPQECYAEVDKIEYIKLPTKIDMDIKELYYINKWKPKYNIKDKQEETLDLMINEIDDNWIKFNTKNEKYIETLQSELRKLKRNNEILLSKIEISKHFEEIVNKMEDAPVFKFETGNINTKRRFTIEEIKTIYKHVKNVSFISNIKMNEVEKYKFVIYNYRNDIHIKELISGKIINFDSDDDDDEFMHIWMMIVNYCTDFEVNDDANINELENILSEKINKLKH